MKQYLLIDIGGTFIKYSLADEQARKISGGKVPTPLTNMDDLLEAIEGFAAPLQGQFVGCAISMPGRIDTRNGIAHTGGMLSAFMWEQPFAAQVEARLGVPVTIAADAGAQHQHRRRHHPEREGADGRSRCRRRG